MINILKNWMGQKYTSKFWTLLACLLFSSFFVLFQGGKLAFMVFIIVSLLSFYLGMGRYSGITAVKGTRALVNVEQDMVVDAGTSVSARVNLQVPGLWPIPYILVKDRLVRRNGGSHKFEYSLVLDWKRRGMIEYLTPPLKRGYYHFEQTDCSTEDVFGLFEHRGSLSMPYSFSVMPKTVPVKEWRQFHQLIKGFHHHSTTTRALRETTQINGVREYIYGDRISRIHWNATARTGTWKSKEFERESLPKTVIMLDRNEKAYANKDQFELAVSIAASLFNYGQQEDLALGLLSVGSDSVYIEPKRSPNHHRLMFNHLIEVEADGRYALIDVLKDRSRNFAQGCFFVIVSPQKNEAMLQVLNWIQHRQMNPCHMWVAEDSAASGREEWLKQLHNAGYLGYGIASLQELPLVLGGRS